MNQEDLKIKNDMLSKISALKAVNDGLKLLEGDEFKKQMESNTKVLEELEAEYKKFMAKAEKDRLAEIKRKQEEGQKIIKDDIAFIGKYMAHIAKLKLGDRPDEKMLLRFTQIKRKAHVINHLRNMKLKGL